MLREPLLGDARRVDDFAEESRAGRVAIIIPNYNHAPFLEGAVSSALEQSTQADEVLVVDDGSTDGSRALIEQMVSSEPRLRAVFNERNLGIVPTFAKAVADTRSEFVAFLGADNRMHPSYVARSLRALDGDPSAGVAYIDLQIFGPLAPVLAAKVSATGPGSDGTYYWSFPEPTAENLARLPQRNFIDGHSMFRRRAYDEAGGFLPSERAEDHDLFLRMIERGWHAVHVPEALVAYRQHSRSQANDLHIAGVQAKRYQEAYAREVARHEELKAELRETQRRLSAVDGLLRTDTPAKLLRTVFINLVGPQRGRVVRHGFKFAQAWIRGQPAPQSPLLQSRQPKPK